MPSRADGDGHAGALALVGSLKGPRVRSKGIVPFTMSRHDVEIGEAVSGVVVASKASVGEGGHVRRGLAREITVSRGGTIWFRPSTAILMVLSASLVFAAVYFVSGGRRRARDLYRFSPAADLMPGGTGPFGRAKEHLEERTL